MDFTGGAVFLSLAPLLHVAVVLMSLADAGDDVAVIPSLDVLCTSSTTSLLLLSLSSTNDGIAEGARLDAL